MNSGVAGNFNRSSLLSLIINPAFDEYVRREMTSVYAVPEAIALAEWLFAGVLYAIGWYRMQNVLNRLGDAMVLAGMVTALTGVEWMMWDVSATLALASGSLATGLAISALAVYATLAYQRKERLSALAMLGLAVPLQAYAVGRLWWGVEVVPQEAFLPLWMVLCTLISLVGYSSLAVGAGMILLVFALSQAWDRLSEGHKAAGVGLWVLEWRSFQIALVALSLSLLMGLIRSWWGLGQVMVGGCVWALATWFLLLAGAYGLIQASIPRRLTRALLVLAGAVAIVAALAMAGPSAGMPFWTQAGPGAGMG
jgi:hypothetical protein